VFYAGKTFLKESFSPRPFQRTFKLGFYFLTQFLRSTIESAMFALHQSVKVFSQVFFKKLARGWGE